MRNILTFLMLALLAMTFGACATNSIQEPEAPAQDAIVAVVDGIPIKKAQFKQELNSTYQRFHQSGQMIDGTMFEQLKTEVLESLINLILMDNYGQAQAITVDDALVEQQYQKAVAKYPSKRKFKKALKDAGLTEADIRMRLKRTMAAQKVVQAKVAPGIKVTDDELKAYYQKNIYEFEHGVQVRASHILIKLSPFADDEERQKAKKRIEAIQKKIKSGEDFAALAKAYSEGPSKVNGGDLGYFGAAQMAPAFETAAFSLHTGEVSDVVTTQFGFHLIKVYDRKPAGKETYSEAAPKLKTRFYQERLNNSLRLLVDKLKSEAKIERFPLD